MNKQNTEDDDSVKAIKERYNSRRKKSIRNYLGIFAISTSLLYLGIYINNNRIKEEKTEEIAKLHHETLSRLEILEDKKHSKKANLPLFIGEEKPYFDQAEIMNQSLLEKEINAKRYQLYAIEEKEEYKRHLENLKELDKNPIKYGLVYGLTLFLTQLNYSLREDKSKKKEAKELFFSKDYWAQSKENR